MAADSSDDGTEERFGDARDLVVERCKRTGIKFESVVSRGTSVDGHLIIELLSGKQSYSVLLDEEAAEVIKEEHFEKWRALGDYLAFYDSRRGTIEAAVRVVVPRGFRLERKFRLLPGVEVLGPSGELPLDTPGDLDDIRVYPMGYGTKLGKGKFRLIPWRLRLTDPRSSLIVEFSPWSAILPIFSEASSGDEMLDQRSLNKSLSVKIMAQREMSHDDALALMEEVSSSFFFEFDLLYGVSIAAVKRRFHLNFEKNFGTEAGEPPMKLPRTKYARSAVSLYSYGRSAVQMPLLEYLAYYQAVEHFFTSFSEEALLARIRREVSDPRFDVDKPAHLQRVVSLARGGNRGGVSEREQLKDTIRGCLDDDLLKEFLSSDQDRLEFLTGRKKLNGVHVINFENKGMRLTDQVAERVYDIRCRIVHSKGDGVRDAEPIIPGSAEVDLLRHDLDLVRFIAQKVIIGGSSSRFW